MRNKRLIMTAAILLFYPAVCFAGGDAVRGIVKDITEKDGIYVVLFLQTDESREELIKGCKEIETIVKHERVPWFSWPWMVKSSHPTKKETVESIEYLKTAKNNRQTVYFGYMGYGLVPTGDTCSFKSKGLKLMDDRGIRFVLSFHDPT